MALVNGIHEPIMCADRIESTVQAELVKVNYLGMSSAGHVRNIIFGG